MAMEKVVFEFPEPEPEPSGDEKPMKVKLDDDGGEIEVNVEVIDDTPPEDRNRKPADPPADVTDEELQDYSEKVRKRIQHFSKGYHDERRGKEKAEREREEALRVAQAIAEENNRLKETVSKNQEILLEQAKKEAQAELEGYKLNFKQAYESGDPDAIVNAQEMLTSAKMKSERVNNFKFTPLQDDENLVKGAANNVEQVVDYKAQDWQKQNPWFGTDDEMTSFALGLHQKLVKQGIDPKSNDYYEKINSRMRQVFPEQFEEDPEPVRTRTKSNVVAPATRSVAPKKITLTQTQVAIAKRLGVPLELYAKQVAEEMRKQNG